MSSVKQVELNQPIVLAEKEAPFTFMMDVMKASESNGKFYLEGKASDTGVDQQDERLSPNAIASLASQVENAVQQIPAYPRHKSDWTETLGYIVEAKISEENELWVKIELDMTNAVAARLWKMINLGRKFGLSVGGFLRSAYFEYNRELQKVIKVLDDFIFDHVVITTKPVNPRTWLKQIGKSLDGFAISPEFLPEEEEGTTDMKKLENLGDSITSSDPSSEVSEELVESPFAETEESLEVVASHEEMVAEETSDELEVVDVAKSEENLSRAFIDLEEQLVNIAFSGASDEELLEIAKSFVNAVRTTGPESLQVVQADRLGKLGVIQRLYQIRQALEDTLAELDPAHEDAINSAMSFISALESAPQEIAVYDEEDKAEAPTLETSEDLAAGNPPVEDIPEESNDFAALLEHNLNKWLSSYGYRVIDVVPAAEEGEEVAMSEDVLPDDAFAHVEYMEDGTKIRKLPYKRKNGKIDKRHLTLALATLNGAMGGVDLSDEGREAAYKALASAWETAFKKPAPALKGAVTKATTPTQTNAAVTEDGQTVDTPENSDQKVANSNVDMVTQLEHLSNIVQQMQEQMLQMQQTLASVNKSFDDTTFMHRPTETMSPEVVAKAVSEELDKMVAARLSTVVDYNNKTTEALDEKLEDVYEAVAKSLDDIKSIKGEVENVLKMQKEFDALKPVLKSLEHLPVRKAFVVDSNRDEKHSQRTAEPTSFSSEEERQAWVRNRLKQIPYQNP